MKKVGVPDSKTQFREEWRIALELLDKVDDDLVAGQVTVYGPGTENRTEI